MIRRLKLMTGFSALALIASACGGEGEGEGEGAEGEGSASAVQAEGEGEGGVSEGEGEGEGANSASAASDDVAFLYRLGMIEGHLEAFYGLYEAGELEKALAHAKHPKTEVYAQLRPVLTARELPGFAGQLDTFVTAAENGDDISNAYQNLLDAINANEPESTVAAKLMAISKLVSTAGDEFSIGVDESGAIVNAHEYQDAYGFMKAARRTLQQFSGMGGNEGDAVNVAIEQIDIALSNFEGWTPTQTNAKASTIYGAAARIEIAAFGLE